MSCNSCNKNKDNKQKTTTIEKFTNVVVENKGMSIVHTVIAIFAIYLSFKCNKGFDFPSFLAAFCCPPCYIIYMYVKNRDCVFPK
jgi:hypothetical protein